MSIEHSNKQKNYDLEDRIGKCGDALGVLKVFRDFKVVVKVLPRGEAIKGQVGTVLVDGIVFRNNIKGSRIMYTLDGKDYQSYYQVEIEYGN